MKKTLTIYFFISSSLFLVSCGDPTSSFFEDIKNNNISLEAVQRLINRGADIRHKDEEGNTLLHVTSSVELAEFFLEQGLDIEARNNKGETPLYTVIERRHYDVALFLKKRGAYGFAEAHNKMAPYDFVIQFITEGNLSPEDRKILDEITRLTWEYDTDRD